MVVGREGVLRIYGRYVRIRDTGRVELRIRSPFREERVASFMINMGTGFWYDFGMGEGGDVVDFVSRVEGIGLLEAKELCSGLVGMDVGGGGVISDVGVEGGGGIRVRKVSMMPEYRVEELEGVNEWGVYDLSGRGIDEEGFRRCGGYMWGDGGVVNVLIRYDEGDIIRRYKLFVYRGGRKRTYTRGSGTIYLARNLRGRHIVLCEGEYDAMSLDCAGYRVVSGSCGAGTFKDEWVYGFSGKEVYVIYDNDEAGLRGMELVGRKLGSWVRGIRYHEWGSIGIKDVGEYIEKGGNVYELIRDTKFLYKGIGG